MDLVKIGRYIAGKRRALGLTQAQLAEKLSMSDKSVSKWERGVCLPDVSVYTELCEALGISINEFLAGEDVGQEDIVKRSEDNLISVTADSKRRQSALKRIIAALLIVAVIATATVAVLLYRANRPQNMIAPLDRDSAEMRTAELLSGADGAFLYRYRTSDSFERLTIFVSVYHSGELIDRRPMALSYESTGSPDGGMIVVVPDFNRFTVKLIVADDASKYSTDLEILEGVDDRLYYGRTSTQIAGETAIRYGEEQGLLALIYDSSALRVLDITELEKGNICPENDYMYYFSFCFSK